MRAELADARLARYAGRFVWLSLNFDKPENQPFLARHGVTYTPAFFVLDPSDERATASQLGGMTLAELTRFLERGERGVLTKPATPADAALARGDELLAQGKYADAASAYSEALKEGGRSFAEHDRAVASFTWALMSSGQTQICAETAAAEAPLMARSQTFSRVVLAGVSCVNQDQTAAWAEAARKTLEPLAAEAVALPLTLRDHRFQLYQQLMSAADARGDKATLKRWGELWLKELDAARPSNEDERTALDVARVDAASLLGEPERVIPALVASERLMPDNYNASLRLAQMETDAKRYAEAIAACERGLRHVTGPLGRMWLLEIEADALLGKGDAASARRVLADALRSAQQIGVKQARERNVEKIQKALKDADKK
ncbi:MAG: tetratricopeptide repeat protein [Acidobacteriota bacterium]|nr:tetratricopeptide repeat protein [Acidobacteriota bacterium]